MRRILLVGAGVIGLVLVSLALVGPTPARASDGGLPGSPAAIAPSSGCLPGIQQCSPVVPQPTAGPTPALLLAVTLTAPAATLVARARIRRRRGAAPLPSGFALPVLHPPRIPHHAY